MGRNKNWEALHRVGLSRRDVIFFEQRLKTIIRSILPFKGHSIHFPRLAEARSADWREDEDRLLLPLPFPCSAPEGAQQRLAENSAAQATAGPRPGRSLPPGFSRNGAAVPCAAVEKPGTAGASPGSGAQRPGTSGAMPRREAEPFRSPEFRDAAGEQAAGTREETSAPEAANLGIFVARGVDPLRAAALLPLWPEIGRLITDNLLQYKRSICDPVTGLFSRHYLLEFLAGEIETLRHAPPLAAGARGECELAPALRGSGLAGGGQEPSAPLSSADGALAGEALFSGGREVGRGVSAGVLVVRFAALRDVVREFGYQFADELMTAFARTLAPLCPEQALAARTGDFEFALCLPSATPSGCGKLAAAIAAAMRGVRLEHPLRRERVGVSASVGFILYPQDMTGEIFLRPPAEQARLVLRKARLAAALADDERPLLSSRQDAEPVLAFSRILAEGGRVLEVLPLSRVMVSLGANMHAREGQRFSVWSVQYPVRGMGASGEQAAQQTVPLYKGEIVLMEVGGNSSRAEVISLGDPSWTIEPGDRLALLPEEQGSLPRTAGSGERLDPDTGLLRHGDFFARWAEERESGDCFTLALLRVGGSLRGGGDPSSNEDGAPGQGGRDAAGFPAALFAEAGADCSPAPDSLSLTSLSPEPVAGPPPILLEEAGPYHEHVIASLAGICRDELGQKVLGGRFGLNSLIFFHPGLDAAKAVEVYEKLATRAEEALGLDIAVGLAPHPCLNFRKADAPENCRKALEYAMLLPRPRVGALDSLALNISADKFFSQGDSFGAIKEYQQALLADENNGMAWNSLGICLAGLGRHAEAERHFARALACEPDNVMAMYNLGYMHQSGGRDLEAEARYRECLERDPEHLYALVRLGQLAENRGEKAVARTFYERAAALPGGESLTRRHFARLCLGEGNEDEAREHLHEALLHDPQDAVSLQLLARLYLDAGEDPDLAAGLARQSVSLRPGLKTGWLELARALEAMGRDQQAREARLRAGES